MNKWVKYDQENQECIHLNWGNDIIHYAPAISIHKNYHQIWKIHIFTKPKAMRMEFVNVQRCRKLQPLLRSNWLQLPEYPFKHTKILLFEIENLSFYTRCIPRRMMNPSSFFFWEMRKWNACNATPHVVRMSYIRNELDSHFTLRNGVQLKCKESKVL